MEGAGIMGMQSGQEDGSNRFKVCLLCPAELSRGLRMLIGEDKVLDTAFPSAKQENLDLRESLDAVYLGRSNRSAVGRTYFRFCLWAYILRFICLF